MKRIIIEQDKCDGCMNCSLACMNAHRPQKGTLLDLDLQDPANETRNFVRMDLNGDYMPLFCRHCDDAECVAACMSGALTKDPVTRHVRYDKEQCAACFMCVMNCPYGMPKPDTATHSYVVRCDFCVDDGEDPNCVKNCPTKAIHVEEVE